MPVDEDKHLKARYTLTDAGFHQFVKYFTSWLTTLQLTQWHWESTRFIHVETYNACVNVKMNEQRFTLDISDSWNVSVTDEHLNRIACHEALHLATYELWEVAVDWCPPAMRGLADRMEHHLITTLENVLVGRPVLTLDLRGEVERDMPHWQDTVAPAPTPAEVAEFRARYTVAAQGEDVLRSLANRVIDESRKSDVPVMHRGVDMTTPLDHGGQEQS